MNESPIWRVKYLPKSLDEISGREDIRNRLREIIKNGNFPHLLFIGSEGIGKTTIARLFAKEFLGRYYDTNFKLVHADVPLTSEERSQARSDAYVSTSKIGSMAGKRITTPAFIQVKIKPFVQLKVLGDVPFKILIVKNFDALGSNQQGFRRLMEIYGPNCRMILITTKISGIIDPIVSRCQLFLVPQIDFKSFSKLIDEIAQKESFKIEDKVIDVLFKISKGKISRAIDILQVCSSQGNKIDMNSLYETTRKFENELIRSLILLSFKGKFSKARDQARKIVSDYKFSSHELFTEMLKVLNKLPLSIYARTKLINMIADADFRAIDGRDDDIQISTLLAKINAYAKCM